MQNVLRKVRSNIFLVIAILILGVSGCQLLNNENLAQKTTSITTDNCPQYSPEQNEGVTLVSPKTFEPSKIVRGQKIFVPFYSQMYQPEGFGRLDLSGTLSISNSSETDKIRITRVHYFNTSGKLVKKCLEGQHSVLSPMATTQFGITRQDDSGGSGANFIIEWVSEKPVSDPVVESIMSAVSGTQAYTFMSSGRVIEEFK